METKTNLIVMLTYNDMTINNAYSVFECCKDTPATYWGIKEAGLSDTQMKNLFNYIKSCNKKTVLEVVAYNEAECLAGAKTAIECNCDILIGTTYFDSVNQLCKDNNIKYMPYIGEVSQRPSVLEGDAEQMIRHAEEYTSKGAFGVNLLAYRYTGNPTELLKKTTESKSFKVCVAGSIDSYDKLDVIKQASPWAITVGSALFDNKFGNTLSEQITNIYNYLNT